MIEYRIVSNGISWRVQRLCYTFFRKRPIWKWCGFPDCDLGFVIMEFDSLEKAQEWLNSKKKEDAAKERGYLPI